MAEKILSDRQCATAKCEPQKTELLLSDGGNLYLRIRDSGEKNWLLIYRILGQRKKLGLGSYPSVSVALARKLAAEARDLVAQGVDPKSHREARERAVDIAAAEKKAEAAMVDNLFREWLSGEASRRKDEGAAVLRAFNKDVLPTIGHIPLSQIRRKDITALLDKVSRRGVKRTCGTLLGDMRQMFEYAVIREIILSNPTAGLKKTTWAGVANERDRVLADDELLLLFQRLPESDLSETTTSAIFFQLATCCRIGEIGQAKWSDINLNTALWTIPADNSKNGKPHVVNLSVFAMDQLNKLKARHDNLEDGDIRKLSPYVLPSSNRNSPRGHVCLKTFAKQITDRQRGDKERMSNRPKNTNGLSLPGGKWVPHDLRRTGATIMGGLGIRPDVIEKCLNHTEQNRIVRIYQRQELRPAMKAAWDALSDHLAALMLKASTSQPV